MKTAASLIFLLMSFVPAAAAQTSSDEEAVRQAALNYIESIYEVDPSRVEQSVHPDLTKLGFFRRRGETEYVPLKMTFDQLVELAGKYNKDGRVPADAPKEVVVFEVTDQTASAKVVAAWGMDYLHLAKYDGQWKIINVLWQSLPPQVN